VGGAVYEGVAEKVVNLAIIQRHEGSIKVPDMWGVVEWSCGSPRMEFIGSDEGFESEEEHL
jgi:hypothetical protein